MFSNRLFENERVQIDGNTYVNCQFRNCRIVFHGIAAVNFDSCVFYDCQWELAGPAGNTVDFLSAVYHGLGNVGVNLVEELFKGIQGGLERPTAEPVGAGPQQDRR